MPSALRDDLTAATNWSLERDDEPAIKGITEGVGLGSGGAWVGIAPVGGLGGSALLSGFSESDNWGPNRNPTATTAVIIATIPETKLMVCNVVRFGGGRVSFSLDSIRASLRGLLFRPSRNLRISPISNKQKTLASNPIPPAKTGAHPGGLLDHHHKIVSGPRANITGVTNSETQTLFCKRESIDRNS